MRKKTTPGLTKTKRMTKMTELKNSTKANFSRRLCTAGVFFLCVTLYAPAQADTELNTTGELHASHGMALFEQGKAAFRAGDYTSAIEAYRESQEAGFSTPVLLYNLGVAHYRLHQLVRAEQAFVAASSDVKLAPLSYYNLGLVARKDGETKNAGIWFSQALSHPGSSQQLRRLAKKAIATLEKPNRPKRRRVALSDGPSLSDLLRFSFSSGFAQDSNIYRSPASSYVDLADPNAPTVDPIIQSGSFIPIEADTELRWGTHDDSYFALKYGFDGKMYSDSTHTNANEQQHEVSIGGVADREGRWGSVYWRSHFVVARFIETAYDRDDGQDQFAGAEDVSDRFSYTHFGPKAYYNRKIGPVGIGFRFNAFINNYDETLDYLDLSHNQYLLGVHLSYKPWQNTFIRASYDRYQRTYAERLARNSAGIRFTSNDDLEYQYQNYGVTFRQRLLQRLTLGLDYRYTQRTDLFEGYDDYNRHSGRVYASMRYKRLNARASFTHRIYDFPNAFAFNLATAGDKTLDTSHGILEAELRVSKHFAINLEAVKSLVESSDPRTEYDRTQIALSLRWKL